MDANSYAAGLAYQVNDSLKIDGGITLATYKSDSYTDPLTGLVIGLEKDVLMFSAGAQYRF